jgi:hypothetical protein
VHVPVPLQEEPLHPENDQLAAGLALKTTEVPPLYVAEQVPVPLTQLIPPTLLVTVPWPESVTVRVYVLEFCVNVADTHWVLFIVTLHEPDPVQAPPQLEKVQPAAGLSDSVATAPML